MHDVHVDLPHLHFTECAMSGRHLSPQIPHSSVLRGSCKFNFKCCISNIFAADASTSSAAVCVARAAVCVARAAVCVAGASFSCLWVFSSVRIRFPNLVVGPLARFFIFVRKKLWRFFFNFAAEFLLFFFKLIFSRNK
jgi:hypothetical protein